MRTVVLQITIEEQERIECLMEPHERIIFMNGGPEYNLVLNLEHQPGHEERRIVFMRKPK